MGNVNCKTCDGSGWIQYLKKNTDISVPEYKNGERRDIYLYRGLKECYHEYAARCPECNGGQAIVEMRKQKANIPAAKYDVEVKDIDWDRYFDDNDKPIDLQKQQMYIEAFVRDFKEWQKEGIGLYIWSKGRGSGKTYISSGICNTLINEYKIVTKFVSAFNLISIEKSASDDKYAGRYDKDPIAELCDCDLLVIDDLGAQNSDNWTSNILYRILNERMENKRITIITSNVKVDNLPFDDKIVDRINATMQNIPLPDCKVRAREANDKKRKLFQKIGLMRKREGDG